MFFGVGYGRIRATLSYRIYTLRSILPQVDDVASFLFPKHDFQAFCLDEVPCTVRFRFADCGFMTVAGVARVGKLGSR